MFDIRAIYSAFSGVSTVSNYQMRYLTICWIIASNYLVVTVMTKISHPKFKLTLHVSLTLGVTPSLTLPRRERGQTFRFANFLTPAGIQ
jgi:hypothetical protein